MTRDRLLYFARIAFLAILYAVFAKLGLMLDAVAGFATLVWPPTGIALAALLLFGYELWPGVALGAFIVNYWTGAPLLSALGIAGGNTVEAVLGAYVLRRLLRFRPPLHRVQHTLGLIVFAGVFSTAVSATVGVISLRLGGIVAGDHFAETWRAWWLGDMLGDLVVASLFLAWAYSKIVKPKLTTVAEGAALATCLVFIGVFVFYGDSRAGSSEFRETYLMFPVLIWAALRFGLRGAATALFAMSVIAIHGTAAGHGPFVREALHLSLLSLQTFMAVAAMTALLLGAASSERTEDLRRREEFMAIVSHDLRGPLGAIQMSASFLQTRNRSDEPLRKHLAIVERSIERMSSLIRDLLDTAVIDAGSLSLTLADEEVGKLLSDSVELARPLAARKSQSIEILLPSAPVIVKADRERILQVLANLLGNAIKFTPESGSLSLSVRPQDGRVEFGVRDTGPGIEPQELRHIYDRFWQSKPGTRAGSGLGLSIVKGIVEAHGGRVWAESRVGDGSTFHFTLPTPSRRRVF